MYSDPLFCGRERIHRELVLLQNPDDRRVCGVLWPADVMRESFIELILLFKVVMVSCDGEMWRRRAGINGRQETMMPTLCSTELF